MLKKLIATLAIVSLALTPISTANAAVKAGAACPKAGNTAIASGKTFTCIKSGKKLVWDKGVLIPKSATSPKTPELPPMPQDFQNLASNLEGIKYWAWKKVNLEIEKIYDYDFSRIEYEYPIFLGIYTESFFVNCKIIVLAKIISILALCKFLNRKMFF